MRKIFFLFLILTSFGVSGQSDLGVKSFSFNMRKEGLVTASLFFNAIDNTMLTSKTGFFDMASNWNIFPFFSTAGVDVNFQGVFSYGGAITISRLYDSVLQQDQEIAESQGYYAMDTNVKWYYYSSGRYGFYTFAGPSLIKADNTVLGGNFGLGADIWITPKFGMRFQTMGKTHSKTPILGYTHAQHSFGGVFHF